MKRIYALGQPGFLVIPAGQPIRGFTAKDIRAQFAQISIAQLIHAQAGADWHDRPLRFVVLGPEKEEQNFSTFKNAMLYRRIRAQSVTFGEAVGRYASLV